MNILLSGSSGLVGRGLIAFLTTKGHVVTRLLRPQSGPGDVRWDPDRGTVEIKSLEGFEAVVHLAGENIASGRWTAAKKERIYRSRVEGTRLLSQALNRLQRSPKVLLCASAIGFYGDRGDTLLSEGSSPGSLFLSNLCRDWEAATQPAAEKGIRVVNLRFGIILSADGGALAQMLLPFRLGLGGKIGSGQQYMSWIAVDDVLEVVQHAMTTETAQGPVNVVAPRAVTNEEFTKTLGRVLGRPTPFPMPAFVARLAFGEMADELLLASTRVEPAQLQRTGYRFQYPQLEEALRHVLGKSSTRK